MRWLTSLICRRGLNQSEEWRFKMKRVLFFSREKGLPASAVCAGKNLTTDKLLSCGRVGVPVLRRERQGWFLTFSGFQHHVKFSFFKGTSLKPVPPIGQFKDVRSLDVRESDKIDEKHKSRGRVPEFSLRSEKLYPGHAESVQSSLRDGI
jgi:hypothetical protein